jgi:2-dehydro-3-deoxyphosphogluconate aldolase/(4S)-4-hydroxy-2-oxoglutarate aldolase
MIERILAKRIVPVVVLEHPGSAEPVAEALLAGGLDIMEITFRTAAAEESIRRIAEKFPEMLLGAGTLLTVDQVKRARGAGAVFGVAPGLNESVVRAAGEAGLEMVPGVMTPGEIERGMELGCMVQKFFPAEAAGGAKTLKALSGPYAHTGLKFVPTGGIHPLNLREYFLLPVVAAIGGSWMVDKKLIAVGNWSAITERTKEALAALERCCARKQVDK